MKTVYIYGAPGAGKLTVGKELSRLTGFSLLHNHRKIPHKQRTRLLFKLLTSVHY